MHTAATIDKMDGPTATHPFAPVQFPRSEAETKLKFCDPSGKGAQGAPEVSRVCEISITSPAGLEGWKIKQIEHIEEVGPHFQVRRFSQMQEMRQPRLFHQT